MGGWSAVSPSDTRVDEFSGSGDTFSGSGSHDFGNVGVLPYVDLSSDPSVSVNQYDNYDSSGSDADCPSCPVEYVNDNRHLGDGPTEVIHEPESQASTQKPSSFDVRKLNRTRMIRKVMCDRHGRI